MVIIYIPLSSKIWIGITLLRLIVYVWNNRHLSYKQTYDFSPACDLISIKINGYNDKYIHIPSFLCMLTFEIRRKRYGYHVTLIIWFLSCMCSQFNQNNNMIHFSISYFHFKCEYMQEGGNVNVHIVIIIYFNLNESTCSMEVRSWDDCIYYSN